LPDREMAVRAGNAAARVDRGGGADLFERNTSLKRVCYAARLVVLLLAGQSLI
jgi:hypothetical protein